MLSACAEAGVTLERVDGSVGTSDGKEDSPGTADAPMTDSPPACTQMTVNLLQNANFDATPLATMWTETRFGTELIVRTDGFAAQSGTTKAWLGGVIGSIGAPATDALHQDVAIPASATGISITGYYHVITGETGTTVYDRGNVDLATTAGTTIEAIAAFDNAHTTTGWTAFDKTFTQNIAGMTVRVKMSSSNDFSAATAFYFDTLALNATVCQ